MCELWLIRHAQTLWNAEKRIQGQSDTPLSPMGIAQAELLRNRLRGVAFDQIYSSDTERAHHTAQLVFGGREILLEPRLREMSYGTLEGKTRTELVGEEREAFPSTGTTPLKPGRRVGNRGATSIGAWSHG